MFSLHDSLADVLEVDMKHTAVVAADLSMDAQRHLCALGEVADVARSLAHF